MVALHKPFISTQDGISFDSATFTPEGDAFRVQNAEIDGVIYDLLPKWRPAEQGMEIIEIDQLTDVPEAPSARRLIVCDAEWLITPLPFVSSPLRA